MVLYFVYFVKGMRRKTFNYSRFVLTPSRYGHRSSRSWGWGWSRKRIQLWIVLRSFFSNPTLKPFHVFLFWCLEVFGWLGMQEYLKKIIGPLSRFLNNPLLCLITIF